MNTPWYKRLFGKDIDPLANLPTAPADRTTPDYSTEEIPEAFADYKPAIAEADRQAFLENLRYLRIEYRDGVEYNVPAIRFLAGQKRADEQVNKLSRARTMLLAAIDAVRRWLDREKAARDQLAQSLDELAKWIDNELSTSSELRGATLKTTRERLIYVAGILRLSPDLDDNIARASKWCSNIADKAWIKCPDCPHYRFEHRRDGGCLAGGIAPEMEASMDACPCKGYGDADMILPKKLPFRTQQGRRRSR